jgi:hypothetical protein
MASVRFSKASFPSAPCDTQPGSAGHSATIQPSSALSKVTWNIISTDFTTESRNIYSFFFCCGIDNCGILGYVEQKANSFIGGASRSQLANLPNDTARQKK